MKTYETEKYVKLTESNSWEGETWYHYFIDEPGVFKFCESLLDSGEHDFTDIECVYLTDEEATVLANLDETGYMQAHFFGILDLSRISSVSNLDLYKGKIRNYAEDLFELVEKEFKSE